MIARHREGATIGFSSAVSMSRGAVVPAMPNSQSDGRSDNVVEGGRSRIKRKGAVSEIKSNAVMRPGESAKLSSTLYAKRPYSAVTTKRSVKSSRIALFDRTVKAPLLAGMRRLRVRNDCHEERGLANCIVI